MYKIGILITKSNKGGCIMSIRFGIIGFGFMGHEHLSMLQEFDGIDVVAICDNAPGLLDDVPDGIKKYVDANDLVKDPDVDVVLIVANNNQHLKLVKAAAEAKKDIICEKPLALSAADLEEMEKVVKENGVKFTVHQQRRFDPDFRTIKQVFDDGSLGDIYTVQTKLYGFNGNMHDWHVYPEQGGGMLYDWGVHLIDQMLWMIPGKIKSVFADVRNVINENVDDYFKILLRFESGITAEVELGTYFLKDPNAENKWFERHWFMGGNKGTAYVDGFDPIGKKCTTSQLLTNVGGQRTMTAAGPTRSFGPPPEGRIVVEPIEAAKTNHRMYFENYVKAYRGEEEFLVQIPQVKRVLAVMDAARESARTMKSVDFE